jgi:hypothetical protein
VNIQYIFKWTTHSWLEYAFFGKKFEYREGRMPQAALQKSKKINSCSTTQRRKKERKRKIKGS